MEEVVSIKHEPDLVFKNEEEGPSSLDGMSSPHEGEEKLTPITEVFIKEEPLEPTLDNLLVITKKEESDLENYDEHLAEQEEEKLFQPDIIQKASDEQADTHSKETEDKQDGSCENQSRSSEFLNHPKCQECRKMFSTVSDLQQHQKTHIAGKKSLQCPICLRVFTHASNLSRHKYVHTGIKNFVCKFCNKKFSQRSNLIQHVTTHTGERPYSCQFCSKTFTWHSNRNQHIQALHHNKPEFCVESDGKSAEQEELPSHL